MIIIPKKALKPCKHYGCPKLTEDKCCEEHKKFYGKERSSSSKRGYDSKWRGERRRFLSSNPFCDKCKSEGRLVKADVIDHIKPHRGDKQLFWDEFNWQPLCKRCHDRKTMTEDRYKEYKY